ncbi:uncharacterized protein Dmul_14650 [Desulfococcus multivorans]|nr:uncharacterized protein Dmul_14650 [Desulfococcus multivorans]
MFQSRRTFFSKRSSFRIVFARKSSSGISADIDFHFSKTYARIDTFSSILIPCYSSGRILLVPRRQMTYNLMRLQRGSLRTQIPNRYKTQTASPSATVKHR